jgi:DNA polymerase-1
MILKTNDLTIEYHENASTKDLEGLVGKYSESKVLYIDTETTGLDVYSSRLLLLQILDSALGIVDVINMCGLETEQLSVISKLIKDKELVIQNATFDLQFLEHNLPDLEMEELKIFDTKIAESVLAAGVKEHLRSYTSLKNIVKRRLGKDIDKETRVEFIGYSYDKFTDDQIKYAALDVMVLPEIRKAQIAEAKKWDLVPTLRVEFELTKHVTRMQLNGVKIDTKLWRKIIRDHEVLKQESYGKVYEAVEPYLEQKSLFDELPFNLNSTDQLLPILTKNVGLKIEDTSEQSLLSVDNPICNAILEYREHEKILSAFGEKTLGMVNKETSRLHPDFNQCSTSTGRFTSDHPNIQQIPSKGRGAQLRKCFIPEEGYKMICADYSQIELRILAELSQEPKLLEAYNNGIDIHTQTASVAFGIPVSQVKADHRKIAKILNFATVYGGGPVAISKGIVQVITEDEAANILQNVFGKTVGAKGAYYSLSKEFVDTYFKKMPMARDWLESAGKSALVKRYSETPLGRKRFYIQELDFQGHTTEELKKIMGSVRRRGMNHPIQGCSADITKIAMNNLGKEFYSLNKSGVVAKMVIQVHDEIVCEVKEEIADEMCSVIGDSMIKAGREFLKSVPVTVDIHVADYWKK